MAAQDQVRSAIADPKGADDDLVEKFRKVRLVKVHGLRAMIETQSQAGLKQRERRARPISAGSSLA